MFCALDIWHETLLCGPHVGGLQVIGTEFVPAIAPINQHIRAGSLEHGVESVELFPRDNHVRLCLIRSG